MAGLTVVTWLYGQKWGEDYVDRLFDGLRRNTRRPIRCALITDRDFASSADITVRFGAEDTALAQHKGCLIRLRLFDRAMQERLGIAPGERIINIDVDAVITGEIDSLFDRGGEFTIMQGFNQTNPCPFNGSLWIFRADERHDVWEDFSIEAARRVPFHAFPDDQAWLHHKFPKAAAFTAKDGVYAFKKITWPPVSRGIKHGLPDNARIVAFPGRDPKQYQWLGWVRKHWGGNLLITPDYAKENARLHAADQKFGADGYLWGYHVAGIAHLENCGSILDYGCGKGTLAKTLQASGFLVSEYDPGYPGKEASPQPVDLVACLDVLEHIEPDCIDDVISDLASLARKKLFVVISTKPSKRLMADGRDTHISLHDGEWWAAQFVNRGFFIDRVWNTGLRLWIALLSPPSSSC